MDPINFCPFSRDNRDGQGHSGTLSRSIPTGTDGDIILKGCPLSRCFVPQYCSPGAESLNGLLSRRGDYVSADEALLQRHDRTKRVQQLPRKGQAARRSTIC
jgi:hypothetical protein